MFVNCDNIAYCDASLLCNMTAAKASAHKKGSLAAPFGENMRFYTVGVPQ